MFLGLNVNFHYFCPMLIKFQFSSHILKKAPTSNFTKIHPEEVTLNRQIDGHDKGEMCFSLLWTCLQIKDRHVRASRTVTV